MNEKNIENIQLLADNALADTKTPHLIIPYRTQANPPPYTINRKDTII